MSFFSTSSPEEAMGTPEDRESHISEIISFLGVSTIGELIWLKRTVERNFEEKQLELSSDEINIYEQKKQEINQLMTEHKSLISKISNLQQEKDSVQKKVIEIKNDLNNVSSEKKITEIERDNLSRELERVGTLYQELTGKQANQEELRDILSIYITLMEEVFSGRAHFKVLSIMHGEKEVWKRSELVKSTGISEIKLRTVLGELARAKIVENDENETTSKLIQRISNLAN